jgi:hypothetical protein
MFRYTMFKFVVLITKQEGRNDASVTDLWPAFSELNLLLLHVGSKFDLLVLNFTKFSGFMNNYSYDF